MRIFEPRPGTQHAGIRAPEGYHPSVGFGTTLALENDRRDKVRHISECLARAQIMQVCIADWAAAVVKFGVALAIISMLQGIQMNVQTVLVVQQGRQLQHISGTMHRINENMPGQRRSLPAHAQKRVRWPALFVAFIVRGVIMVTACPNIPIGIKVPLPKSSGWKRRRSRLRKVIQALFDEQLPHVL